MFGQNQTNIQTTTSPIIMKQFKIVKHHKTQNVKLYKFAIPKISKFLIFDLEILKKYDVKKHNL